jgi:hypothetical protein
MDLMFFLFFFLFFFRNNSKEISNNQFINEEVEIQKILNSTILQVIIITRHGDRTPTRHWPPFSKSNWSEGLGLLTHIGMKQHFELGQKFKKLYIEEYKLISNNYKYNEIYVRSSPKERTLMSAQSFMHGFFYPTNNSIGIQPIPIYSSDTNKDYLLYGYKNCPKLKILSKMIKQSEEWVQMTMKHKELLNELSTIFHFNVTLSDITGILNLLQAEEIHNKTRTEGITKNMLDKMKEISVFVFKKKFHSKEAGRLGAGNLIKEIFTRFSSSVELHSQGNEPIHKFILFSAHDGTLLALMAALGLNYLELPKYASHIVFELHFDNQLEKYYVKVLYNDKLVKLPNCSIICHFQQFQMCMKEGIVDNWHQECENIIIENSITCEEQKIQYFIAGFFVCIFVTFNICIFT